VWYRAVSDVGGVNAEEPDSELDPLGGEGRDGVVVGDPLDGSNQCAGGSGVGGAKKEYKKAEGNSKNTLAYGP